MNRAVFGALVGAGLVAVVALAFCGPSPVFAQRPLAAVREAGGEGGLIALPSTTADSGQLVTLVDPRTRVIAVYRIDATTGKIKLLSVRNIGYDLQVMELNSEKPTPQELRSLLEQR
jgi:hypothetical protein